LPDLPGCWLWSGALSANGYGHVFHSGKRRRAHRLVYDLMVGKIPPGLQIDHLCRVRSCVNPEHMEPVTGRTNVLRGKGVTARNATKTHCPRGHAFADHGVRHSGGSNERRCRPCRAAINRLCYARTNGVAVYGMDGEKLGRMYLLEAPTE